MTIVVEGYKKIKNKELTQKEAMKILQDIKDGKRDDIPRIVVEGKKIKKSELEKFKDAQPEGLLKGTIFDYVPDPHQTVIYLKRRQEEKRNKKAEGGELDAQMAEMMKEPTHTMPDGTEMTGASHEDYEEIMAEEPLVPDEEMEDDYTDFVINESLSQEDEDYLLEKLSADDRLSTIFDRVVETASEFAGSGPVEGPGTERSDSIPARLSDGEFVVTSKAADKIGPDNLQGMMEQAELESDMDEVKRQIKQAGGVVEEEEQEEKEVIVDSTVSGNKSVVMPASITDRKIKESMLSLNPRNSLFTS